MSDNQTLAFYNVRLMFIIDFVASRVERVLMKPIPHLLDDLSNLTDGELRELAAESAKAEKQRKALLSTKERMRTALDEFKKHLSEFGYA